jgi:putative PEP-CTERM system histidine kinase
MIIFSQLSYAAVGGFYALLAILLLVGWSWNRIGAALILACVISAGWGGILALDANGALRNFALVSLMEILRPAAWITFLVLLVSQIGVGKPVRYASILAWVAILAMALYQLYIDRGAVAVASITNVSIPGGLILALTGLMLIEQLYRNSGHEARWGLKPLCLGLGGMFAYDLFLYSQAMLFGAVDSDLWMARGAVNLLFLPLIAIAARRNPTWDLDIFVSRQVVFYTTSLLAVGVYLLLMSFGGYLLVLFGGTWGAVAQIVFFVGSLIVLLFLLFSSSLRARLRVFLSKHFFRNKYDYREEWMRLVSTLARSGDGSTHEIVIKALVQIVDSSAGTLWILEEQSSRYRFAGSYGTDASFPDIAITDPVVRFVEEEGWVVDLDEYRDQPDRYGDLELPEWLANDRDAWLLVPLVAHRQLVGLILIMRPNVRINLNYEDRDLLKTVGSHIAVNLAQEQADRLLTESRQFDTYNRLTAFLMHDLNNLIAQQSLIVANAEKHRRNPEFVDDSIQTIANSVDRMKRVMDQLRRGGQEGRRSATDLSTLLEAAVGRCTERLPCPELEPVPSRTQLTVNRDQFIMVIAHLIKNAQDATGDGGSVRVRAETVDGRVVITIEDNGAGMTPAFIRDRLFKPFDSTKGTQGMGIGAYQAREYARGLGGDLEVKSEPGVGTTVRVVLPTDRAA